MRPIDADALLDVIEQIDWYSVSEKSGRLFRGATTEDDPVIHYYECEAAVKEAPTIDAVPAPNYRVPSTKEWMERYCTKKQLAGYEKRKEGANNEP